MMRTKMWLLAALAMMVVGIAPSGVRADAPSVLPIQGYVTDAGGLPLEGPSDVTFSLYTSESGGTPVYAETQSLVVEQGYFTAYVGDSVPLDLAVFRDNGTLYVGIRVGADPEMSPRALLGSVPYAAYAQFAPWAGLSGVPADLADGDDRGPSYVAGTGISISGTTISADTAAVQARVSGTCAVGQAVTGVNADGTVACASTTYTAGTGLTLTGTTFTADTSALQARVTGSCPVGQSVRVINADGTVTCETDDDTTYTAAPASGITLTGTALSADTTVVQRRVTGTCSAGQAVTAIAANGTVTCAAAGATYTAGTGLTLTGTSFAVNTTAIQARVTGTCAAGQAVTAIGAGGTVTCAATGASYTAATGGGLTLTGTAFAADTAVLQARVTGTCPAGQAVTGIGVGGTVTCASTVETYTAAPGGGLTLTGNAFAVNTASVQARVGGTCLAGASIRSINPDGTVVCEVDDGATYTGAVGSGVIVTGTALSADTTVVQARVTGTCAAGQAVTAIGSGGTVTCAATGSAYTAGTGLTLTGTSFAVNTAAIQARVGGSCVAGQSIRTINADGTVVCEVDDGATYTAGAGLTLTGTTFAVSTGAITGAMLADNSINELDLALQGVGTVTSTTPETIQSHFMGDKGGITTARVQITVNGMTGRGTMASGGNGTATVLCDGTTVATIALEGGGSRPWLHITPSFSIATCSALDINVSAAAAGAPVYIRSLNVIWAH